MRWQEFRVQSNGYSAEYGHSAGAVVNVTIKSGSNQFHGTGWEFFRNDRHGRPRVDADSRRSQAGSPFQPVRRQCRRARS